MGRSTFSGPIKSENGFEAESTGQVKYDSATSSDSDLQIALSSEQAVEAIGTFTASHKIKIRINGTEYWLQLDEV